jgi:acetyl-CoA hydrolase
VIADYTAALIEAARCVIVEIDERLPLTADDASFASELVDVRVAASDMAQIELPDPTPREQEVLVARRVADLVPDGATVQVGIGGLPVAVLAALRGHRGLQIHSGVVPDAVVGLAEAGAVTGRLVTGGLFGSQRLFEFADGNPDVCMRSAEFTHSGAEMARIDRFHTVNSAIEVDLTGQVNSEVAAGRYLGAVGGQVDFVRGAQLSPGGRSIIALPAATEDGRTSRIVAALAGPVTTARSDVDFIVTDFGTADLRGRSLAERAKRLASIAHPSFRETLLAEAHDMRVAEI